MFDPISLVGMTFRLPGACSEQQLWSLLTQARSAISPIPKDRWTVAAHHSPRATDANKTVMQRGGFLDQIDGFDAAFFGLSAREVRAMDPQQRMLLESTWHCLENAGLDPDRLRGGNIGVFTGVMATDYQQNATAPGQTIDGFACLGTYGALLANRISHLFEWTGPSYTVDAACASSLVALDAARRAVQAGEVDFALVAAANALIHPWRSISFSQARMLGSSGACHSFSAQADGYVQGEGCAAVLLCTRKTAARHGLTERALVLGSAVNHVGPSRSQTAPSVDSQRALITAALQNARVSPDQLGYIEAHGTGTPLGDPIEVGALAHVLGARGDAPCAIGSIKSNIGHLEAAAGLAGLVKLVMMLERQTLVPGHGSGATNPLIDFDSGPLRPVTEVSDWPQDRQIAGISSFGFGGANAHAVLTSAAALPAAARGGKRKKPSGALPLLLSAKTEPALKEMARALATVAQSGTADLSDVCQTLMTRRASLPCRAAAMVRSWDEAKVALDHIARQGSTGTSPARLLLRLESGASLTETAWDKLIQSQPDLAALAHRSVAQAKQQGVRACKRLTQLSRLDAILRLVLHCGLSPDVIQGDGLGRWASLSATDVLDVTDAVLATGEADHPAPHLRRPKWPVWDAVSETVLTPRPIEASYITALAEALDTDIKALPQLAQQAQGLSASNRTYMGYLSQIGQELESLGHADWRDWRNTPPQDPVPARLALLAFGIARHQTCARWDIPLTGVSLEGSLPEIAELVRLQALSVADALSLADLAKTETEAVARCVARADLGEAGSNQALPRLHQAWSRLHEIENVELWLRGRRGRSRKAGPFDTTLTVNIGTPSSTEQGQSTTLPLDEGFGPALRALMAARWADGVKIDWSVCAAPHRVAPLPPYPFQRQRYWLDMPDTARSEAQNTSASSQPLDQSADYSPAQPLDQPPAQSAAPAYDIRWVPPASVDPRPSGPIYALCDESATSLASFAHLSQDLPDLRKLTGTLNEATAQDVVQRLGKGSAATLILTAPLGWSLGDSPTEADLTSFCRDTLVPLVRFVHDLRAVETSLHLVLLGQDHQSDASGPLPDPALAAATAAITSVTGEHPDRLSVLGLALPKAFSTGPNAPKLTRAALVAKAPLGLASLSGSGLLVKAFDALAKPATPTALPSGPCLVIGGFGGVGLSLLTSLGQGGRPLAVIGRRAADQVQDHLASLEAQGVHLSYYSVDATQGAPLAGIIDRIEAELGPIETLIHAEMVLADATAANMDAQTFDRAFRPKAAPMTALRRLFAHRRPDSPLPKQIVFSSVLGLTGNPGQANYTAGSAFQMAICDLWAAEGADALAIAWGYWGEDGRVANPMHQRRVARIGLLPMRTAAGLASFDGLLSGARGTVVAGEFTPKRLAQLRGSDAPEPQMLAPKTEDPATQGLELLDSYAIARMRAALEAAGWAPGDSSRVAPDQMRLFTAVQSFLQAQPDRSADALYADLNRHHPQLAGIVSVIKAATDHLVDVLSGAMPGTSVLFGGGNTDLLDGFYAGNPLADGANNAIAKAISEAVKLRLAARGGSGVPLRILEIGAGTGGTTRPVLAALQPFAPDISFVFSDISPAFLRRAKKTLGPDRPWFSTARYDFDADPDSFAELGQFDLIFAANAVHVTQHIAPMLKRVQARLAPGGSLILNELMRPMPHLTAIFGLLPGWWAAQDDRAGFGPLLSETQWRAALSQHFVLEAIDGPRDARGVVQGIAIATLAENAATQDSPAIAPHVAHTAPPQPEPVAALSRPVPAAGEATVDDTGILAMLADVLGISPDRLDREARFDELGLDSILSLEFSDRLAAEFDLKFDPATIADLATPARLLAKAQAAAPPASRPASRPASPTASPSPASPTASPSPAPATTPLPAKPPVQDIPQDGIAIIGMAGQFSGARSLAALAEKIRRGAPAFAPVPDGRWSAKECASAPDIAEMRGAFLQDAECFDAARFGISAREAILMPPEHRLGLEQTLAALSDAARPDLRMGAGAEIGVFVGGSSFDYGQKLLRADHPVEPQSLAAQLGSGAAARIAWAFGFSGPALTVDLACASGLGALHLATRALREGECGLAIVVAASVQSTPGFAAQVHRAGILSVHHSPRPFDSESVGIMLGEGVVALVLKPARQAVADGDRIDAIIAGTALRQSAGQDGMTAPSAETQHHAMSRALSTAGLQPHQIGAVEAHGVGTSAGDTAELAALTTLFRDIDQPIAIDTVKPFLGHGLAVSGLSSLALTALAWRMDHRLSRFSGTPQTMDLHKANLVPAAHAMQDAQPPLSGPRSDPRSDPLSGPVLVNGFSLNGAAAAAVLTRPAQPFPPREETHTEHRIDDRIETREICLSAALASDLQDRLAAVSDWLASDRISAAEAATILAHEGTRRCAVVLAAPDTETLRQAVRAALGAGSGSGPLYRYVTGSPQPVPLGAAPPLRRPIGFPFVRTRFWPAQSATPVAAAPPPMPAAAAPQTSLPAITVIASALRLAPDQIDDHAVLLDLGLDSLLAIELRGRLMNQAGLSLPLSDLMSRKTLAQILDGASKIQPKPDLLPDRAARFDPFALTELQLGYLVGRSPAVPLGGHGCHVYWELQSDTHLDVARLSQAWDRLVRTHDMLRAVFTADGQQQVQPEVTTPDIPLHDWSHLDDARAATALDLLRQRMSHEVFEPTHWPLFRIEVSQRQQTACLHLSIDLLIVDVLSLFRLLRQWAQLYHQPDTVIHTPQIGFRDYVHYLNSPALDAERQRALSYWQSEMAHMPAGPHLPRARGDADLTGAGFARRRVTLAPQDWARWQARARDAGATPVAALCSAFGATLAYWSAAPELALNLTIYNRHPVHPELDQVIGDFTSTVLMPSGHDPDGFAKSAVRFAEKLAQSLDHTVVSSAEAVRRFVRSHPDAPSPASALPYVFTSMIGYDAVIGPSDTPSLGRLRDGVTQTPQVLIDVQAVEEDGALTVTWDCVEAAYPDGLLDSAFAGFSAMIHDFAQPDADWTQSAYAALRRRDEMRRAAVNATDAPICDDLLHEPILRQAMLTPDRVALITSEGDWTYRDLVSRAYAIAEICATSSQPLIGVALPRGAWQIAATLGILISGAAYLPLDPTFPADRFQALATRGEVDLILTDTRHEPGLSPPNMARLQSVDTCQPADLSQGLPLRRTTAEGLAYVLFTSGSTGEPKGVMLDHRAALNTVLDVNDRFGVGPNDRAIAVSSLGFDLSVYDIFGPLAVGGALVLPDPGAERDPDQLTRLIATHGVTLWNSVPMLMEMLAANAPNPAALVSLRLVMLSGDWIPTTLPAQLEQIMPQARLISLGGATEAAIWSICHDVSEARPAWSSIPYGRPMRNQRFHILDAALCPVPEGVEGDLYIAGAGLARGYWRDQERTEAAFFTHPDSGERLYRTGDLGRWRDGDLIEFLGRKDGQVKIGGFRVELGEVEARARAMSGVHLAVAIADGPSGGARRLRLWAMAQPGTSLERAALKDHLARALPAYMVPAQIEIVDALPLTSNGKVDRAALLRQHPDHDQDAPTNQPHDPAHDLPPTPAATDLPAAIAAIVAQEIGLTAPDPQKTFFELGADSLKAVTINRRLRTELGLETRVTDLFEHPSIDLLTRYLAPQNTGQRPRSDSRSDARADTTGVPALHETQTDRPQTDGPELSDVQRSAHRRKSYRASLLADILTDA